MRVFMGKKENATAKKDRGTCRNEHNLFSKLKIIYKLLNIKRNMWTHLI